MNWKVIKHNENYSINEYGEVKNNTTGIIRKANLNHSSGYYCIDLWKDNKGKKYAIHRLVAEAFIPNPLNKPTVDHIDGNRTNNSVDNLRWATYSEQNSRFNTYGVASKKVKVTNSKNDEEMLFKSVTDVANYFNVCVSNISQMIKKGTYGKRGRTRYYKLEYVNKKIENV